MREYIICSAIHIDDNKVHPHKPKNIETGFVVCGRRHHNCYATLCLINPDFEYKANRNEQGFLTNTDRFVNRKEAFQIARCASQLRLKGEWDQDSILTSEDLY